MSTWDKTIFVLPSFVGLHFIIKHFDFSKYSPIVLTNNPSVFKWCNAIGLNVVMTPSLNKDLSRSAIRRVRRENEAIASQFYNYRIYYFFYLSNMPMIHLVSRMKRHNSLHFYNADPILQEQHLHRIPSFALFRKFFTSTMAYIIFLGIQPKLFKYDRGFIHGKILRNRSLLPPDKPLETVDNTPFLSRVGYNGAIDVLYIDNLSTIFPKAMEMVTRILKKISNLGLEVVVKPHPTMEPSKSLDTYQKIDAHIPAEVCLSTSRIILGVTSSSLRFPTSGIVISLMNLLPLSEELKNQGMQILKSDNIIFVKSEDELMGLIQNISGKDDL